MAKRQRYIRTFHLPFSLGGTSDDKMLGSTAHFEEREVVVTTKLDGANMTFTRDEMWARSPDSDLRHERWSYAKRTWAAIRHEIPVGWRVLGEYMYAKHSIYYDYLPSYFMGFAVINENDVFLPWEDTVDWFELLGLEMVPVIWGPWIWDEGIIRMLHLCTAQYTADQMPGEGFVVRVTAAFHQDMSKWRIAKWVRPNHVTTDKHWTQQALTVNRLRIETL